MMINKLLFLLALLTTGLAYPQSNIQVNEQAPPITITDWIENVPHDTSLTDKYIVLEFWATWCGPCIAAVPHMNSIQQQFSQEDLYYISITDESVEKVERKLKRIDFQSIVVTDLTKQTQINFGDGVTGLDAYPLTVLIDKSGITRWVGDPMALDAEIMAAFLAGETIPDEKGEAARPGDEAAGKPVEKKKPKQKMSFMELLNNKDVPYYFELEETEGTSASKLMMGVALMRLNDYRLEDIFSEVLRIDKKQLTLPDAIRDKRFTLVYKNTDESGNTESLEKALMEELNLEKKVTSKPDKVYSVSIKNESKLEVTLEANFSSRSDAGDKLIFTAYSINKTLEELSGLASAPFRLDEEVETKYDFIIEVQSDEAMINSLKSYGLSVKEKEVELEFISYVGKP